MRRPKIALPEINQDVTNYVRALTAAGMEPVLISVRSEQIMNQYQQEYLDYSDFQVNNYDGLLIPGGWDVHPARYGQEIAGSVGIHEDLDELQFSVLDAFVKKKKPVLGICRGHQLINVYFGGTLIQHLPTSGRHAHVPDVPDKIHAGQNIPSSWIEKIYGPRFLHNSAHHQAVDRPGGGLVIDSVCPDDQVVEAMHHEKLPVFSVQWHPERMCLSYAGRGMADGLEVLRFFCRICGGWPEAFRTDPCEGIMYDRMGL